VFTTCLCMCRVYVLARRVNVVLLRNIGKNLPRVKHDVAASRLLRFKPRRDLLTSIARISRHRVSLLV